MMRVVLLNLIMLVCGWSQVITALVTLQTMNNLTELTDDYRGRFVESGSAGSQGGEMDEMARVLNGQQAVLMGGDDDDGDEVEDTVAAALRLLCSDLLFELEKPVDSLSQEPLSSKECQTVIRDYHKFLAATVKFLYEVQQRQLKWRWSADSSVFDGVSWMQGLWASRSANTQELSFIEQQMRLYSSTGCFGKSKEVLQRDVEIVEYLNDLMDSFN